MILNVGYAIVAFVFVLLPLGAFIYAVVLTESAVNAAESLGAYLGAVAAIGTALFVIKRQRDHQIRDDMEDLNSIYNMLNVEVLELISILMVIEKTFIQYFEQHSRMKWDLATKLGMFPKPIIYFSNTSSIGQMQSIDKDFPNKLISFHMEFYKVKMIYNFIERDQDPNLVNLSTLSAARGMMEDVMQLGLDVSNSWMPDNSYSLGLKKAVLKNVTSLLNTKKGR